MILERSETYGKLHIHPGFFLESIYHIVVPSTRVQAKSGILSTQGDKKSEDRGLYINDIITNGLHNPESAFQENKMGVFSKKKKKKV